MMNKYLKYKNKYLNLINQKGQGKNNNDICPICQESFPPPCEKHKDDYMHLDTPEYKETICCKHIYHTACIEQWLKTKTRCPTCSTDPVRFLIQLPSVDGLIHHVSPLDDNKIYYQKLVIDKLKRILGERPERIISRAWNKFKTSRDAKIVYYYINFLEIEDRTYFNSTRYSILITGESLDTLKIYLTEYGVNYSAENDEDMHTEDITEYNRSNLTNFLEVIYNFIHPDNFTYLEIERRDAHEELTKLYDLIEKINQNRITWNTFSLGIKEIYDNN